jgi:hypothetical protein
MVFFFISDTPVLLRDRKLLFQASEGKILLKRDRKLLFQASEGKILPPRRGVKNYGRTSRFGRSAPSRRG